MCKKTLKKPQFQAKNDSKKQDQTVDIAFSPIIKDFLFDRRKKISLKLPSRKPSQGFGYLT